MVNEAKVMLVHIEIEVEPENIQDFLETWPEYKERLIEMATVKNAWAEIPEMTARRIELR